MGILRHLAKSVGEILSVYENIKLRIDWYNIIDADIALFCKHWKLRPDLNYIPGSNDSTEFLFKKVIYHMCVVTQHNKNIDPIYVTELGHIMLCFYIMGQVKNNDQSDIIIPHLLQNNIDKYANLCKIACPRKLYYLIIAELTSKRNTMATLKIR